MGSSKLPNPALKFAPAGRWDAPSARPLAARSTFMWDTRKFTSTSAAIMLCALISGCGLFDSGIEWRSGPYALLWIDTPDNVSLSYDRGSGSWAGRVEPQVFAVGENDQYIVAKQHPIQNKLEVDYYIVLRGEDSVNANSEKVVLGPLTAAEFDQKSKELNLPQFSKVLEALQ